MAFFPDCKTSQVELASTIAKEITEFYPRPNVFNLESAKHPMWISERKKNYIAMEATPPGAHPKLTIKGLAFKKRSAPPFVRQVGHKLAEALVQHQDSKKAINILQAAVLELFKVDISQLAVSCSYAGMEHYKTHALVQVGVANKIKASTGIEVEPGTRISYVIVAGPELVSARGEEIESAKTKTLDYVYYIDQMNSLLSPLFEYHGVSVADVFKKARESAKNAGTKTISMLKRKREQCE
jgi:DNA polymerase elongation subunit (family B)